MIDQQQIQQTLRGAPPGTIVEAILRFIVPPAVSTGEQLTEVDIASEPEPVEGTDPARQTPLQRVLSAEETAGATTRKEGDWAADVCRPTDFPARELERACQAGAITWEPKTWGKDAGARMITAGALEAYLNERERVRRGDAAEPKWWADVVSARHRRAG